MSASRRRAVYAIDPLLTTVLLVALAWRRGQLFEKRKIASGLLSSRRCLDPLFVGAHHLARFFMIALSLPFYAKALKLSGGDTIAP